MMWGRGYYGMGGNDWVGLAITAFFVLVVLVGIVLLVVWLARELGGDRGRGRHHGYGGGGYGGPGRYEGHRGPGVPIGGGYGQGYGEGYGQGYAPGRRDAGSDPAVIAARERYARGEIGAEQLDEIMRNLGYAPSDAGPPPRQEP